MRSLIVFLFAFCCISLTTVWAQFPALEFSIQQSTAPLNSTADVSFYAGTNWQNITSYSGTISFDTTKITWNSLQFWGLSNPGGAVFTYQGGGVVTFTWNSLITIGPTLTQGQTIFTLRFNTVGNAGDVSPVTFGSSPQVMFWGNGFGWSGNNFQFTNGSVTLVCANPVPAFTTTPNNLNITFTDASTPANAYFWDFGDGNTSTAQNPSHTYSATGQYLVCLTVVDSCGADSVCQTLNVTCPVPGTSFSNSANGLMQTFSDQSSNSPSSWFWDFGDGNTSNMQNPSHSYAAPGNYTVCLTTTNSCGSDSSCQVLAVSCPAATAAFSDSTNQLQVQFTDLSGNTPTAWTWDFGDGNTSTQQNPSHIYAQPGTYTVCLIATNLCGADTSCQSLSVTCAAPMAAFSDSVSMLQVQFSDLSTNGPTTWFWDFGDGNTSTQASPLHTYAGDGTYTVCLTVSSLCGADTLCRSLTILTTGFENPGSSLLRVYPNPATEAVWVESRPNRYMKLRLYDLNGELLGVFEGQEKVKIATDHLTAGVYVLEVRSEGELLRKKMVIR